MKNNVGYILDFTETKRKLIWGASHQEFYLNRVLLFTLITLILGRADDLTSL